MTFLVFLIMVFLLFEASGLPAKLQDAFGWRDEVMSRFTSEIQRYLAIKTLVSLGTGFLIGFGMWLSGVGYFLLWGLIAFLFNYVPNVGSILAAVPPVILSLLDAGFGKALLVGLIYLAVNLTLGNFIEPHLMGRQFGISTLVVVLSLIFWGWLWGPVGMLLSVPLTMIVKIMLENTEDLRWVARLIGANPRPGAVEMKKPSLVGTAKG
jgi:predicted PurR-regulated permease PerM